MKGRILAWQSLSGGFIILFFNAGARLALGVIFKPVIKEFGWERADVSLVFFINMAVFSAALLVVGGLYDRYGVKLITMISTLLLSSGFVLASCLHSFKGFLFSYGILAALGFAGTSIPLISTFISTWFERFKSTATGLSLAGNSIGQFVLVPLFNLSTLNLGWRTSLFLTGVVIFFINLLVTFLLLKDSPERFANKRSQDRGLSLKEAAKKRSFWLFVSMMFICGGGDFFVTTHFIPLATDHGISPTRAGNMLGLYGFMSLLGMLLAGLVADLKGARIPIILTFSLRFFLFLMIYYLKTLPAFYIFALLFGFTHLVTAPLTPALAGKLFGTSSLGIITGFINTVHFLAGGLMAYLGGLLFDLKGDYQPLFLLMIVLSVIAVFSMVMLKEKREV